MEKLKSSDRIMDIYNSHRSVVFYIGDDSCSVCRDLYPKIAKLEERYSEIDFYKIDYKNNLDIMGELSVFTIPTIIGKIDAREFLREARFISLNNIVEQIDRYYQFIKGDD